MRYVAGWVWRAGRFEEGWLGYAEGRIEEAGPGEPPSPPVAAGVIVPAPVNAHTHVGDAVARGQDFKGKTLAELFAPPHGLKHQILAKSSDEDLARGIGIVADEMRVHGTSRFIDFREGGVRGLDVIERGLHDKPVSAVVLARPRDQNLVDKAELDALLSRADGIGLSGLGDVPLETARALAREARAHGKRFALHLSEGKRESVEDALDLRPWFLVHCVHATDADLERIADVRVPVVVCPRSNAFFGALPDVAGMLEAGLTVALGTDNAMLQSANVFEEMRFLARAMPDLPLDALLSIGLEGGQRVLFGEPLGLEPGAPAEFAVLSPQSEDPLLAIFGEAPPRVTHTSF